VLVMALKRMESVAKTELDAQNQRAKEVASGKLVAV